VKESGYDGRPVVVLQVTDRPIFNAAAVVTRQRLESIGFNVILNGMDWSTNLVARTRNEQPDKGGWNLLHTLWQAADVINPAVHFGVSGAGPRAWFGWPDIPQIEKLITDWGRATDEAKRQRLADEVQRIALSEVTYVPWGEWSQPTAFPKERPGCPQIHSADFLECEARIGSVCPHELRMATSGRLEPPDSRSATAGIGGRPPLPDAPRRSGD
jgi:peptide/nickel transport system substrate-binding protein